MPLDFTLAPGFLRSLRIKKAGKGKAVKKPLATLGLDVRLPVETLVAIDPMLPDALFNGAAIRFPMLKAHRWDGEILHMALTISELDLRIDLADVRLSGLAFSPYLDGNGSRCIGLAFAASFEPVGASLAQLSELVQTDVNVTVRTADLFANQQDATP